ncbi:hypothetical protein LX36DRAFT_469106 [Colletotrichum falcatum]|nr:hypothetical protein LX36DRAFT_469106 [Colletotrichum falcatum]
MHAFNVLEACGNWTGPVLAVMSRIEQFFFSFLLFSHMHMCMHACMHVIAGPMLSCISCFVILGG